jgi:GMP synthase-like glutamine amidotransferase
VKPVLLVRNDPFETFGVATRAFDEAGMPAVIWGAVDANEAPDLEEVGGVVVFGSSYNVEHADEQPFIHAVADLTRNAVDRNIPCLGVCFGAQLLAWSLGGEVQKAAVREVGFEPIRPLPPAGDDALLSHYAEGDLVFQWHMDTFTLPPESTLLMTGDAVVNQAFRVGEQSWGIQFHLEIDDDEIELWLDEYDKEGDLLADWGKNAAQVRAEADSAIDDHERHGVETFKRFADLVRQTP